MKEIIKSHINLSDEGYNLLNGIAIEKNVDKNQILFFPNKPTNKILFLKKGLLRGYKIIDGKDYTHHFYFANWFATDFSSFLNGNPSQLFIESTEDSSYFEFQKKDLYSLYNQSHEIEKLGRLIAEKAFLATVEKLADLQLLDLHERYEALMLKNPDLFQRVPQKYIASFMGVSEQSLSRIKNN
ncbi:Crp/Fnr family transcriptional regulator [Psychroserpens sp. BH13MA-6]